MPSSAPYGNGSVIDMQVIRTVEAMRAWSQKQHAAGRRIGFVPTMGYLHAGHLSLVTLARQHTDAVVLSIFVNPTQFLPGEDLHAYPRDFDRDAALCRDAGVSAVFAPTDSEMYAEGHSVYVDEQRLSHGLCGASRPGHFRGVTTVVAKLFNIVLPDVAVFGQKDAQQVRVVQRMVRDLNIPVEIVVGPIVREADGLAMSSRNKYLSPEERRDALCLRRALDTATILFTRGTREADTLRRAMRKVFDATPSATVDYIEIVDNTSLEPVTVIERPALLLLAVRIGKTRLIDNAILTE